MSDYDLGKRTMGELAAMRDALHCAKEDLKFLPAAYSDPAYKVAKSLNRVIEVVDSILSGGSFSRTHEEYERLRYRSPGELKRARK